MITITEFVNGKYVRLSYKTNAVTLLSDYDLTSEQFARCLSLVFQNANIPHIVKHASVTENSAFCPMGETTDKLHVSATSNSKHGYLTILGDEELQEQFGVDFQFIVGDIYTLKRILQNYI